MPSMEAGWDPGVALVAAGLALVHVVFARRIDLGPLTVAVAGIALLGASPPSEAAWGALGAAALVSGAAWWRGARAGTGRPELTGSTLAVVVLAAACVALLPSRIEGLVEATVRAAVVGPVALVGLLGLVAAASRRGPSGLRIHHHREIPVQSARRRA